MTGMGHNQGPTMEGGTAWRKHCWGKARAELLPKLPLEVVRIRVKRAQELGLAYRTYATVRATTGHDIVAFLFSSNALRLHRPADALPQGHADKLKAQCDCGRLLAAHRPLDPAQTIRNIEAAHGLAFLDAIPAPLFTDSWSAMRDRMVAALGARKLRPSTVLVIGETGAEREWSVAGRMAGYLPAGHYFG
ncbi:hypothetical protein [Actibacterium sp. D379-3]